MGFTLPRSLNRFDTYARCLRSRRTYSKIGECVQFTKVKNSVSRSAKYLSLVSGTLTIVSNSSSPGFSKDG